MQLKLFVTGPVVLNMAHVGQNWHCGKQNLHLCWPVILITLTQNICFIKLDYWDDRSLHYVVSTKQCPFLSNAVSNMMMQTDQYYYGSSSTSMKAWLLELNRCCKEMASSLVKSAVFSKLRHMWVWGHFPFFFNRVTCSTFFILI